VTEKISSLEDRIDEVLSAYVSEPYPQRTKEKRERAREELHTLGQKLFDKLREDLGVDLPVRELHISFDNIANRDPTLVDLRICVLDKAWDGIGTADWHWMA
jgi:hypothetical protein